jgi:putative oxidoreductase
MKEFSRGVTIVLWVLQVLAAAAFIAAGIPKLAGAAPMVQMYDVIGIGQWFRYATGIIEVGSAVLLLIPAGAVIGAILLVCTMVGAILTHLLVLHSSPVAPMVLLAVVGAIALLRRSQIGALLGGRPKANRQGA